ncbi:BFH_collapsed_G0021250.mRNA.1.CDS.1 [Saccharomyces cerevisiae]|nr:BFH_collapsed_G0021250.mRNA.1.CDS.1 [Saccharomyces cerevisiae]
MNKQLLRLLMLHSLIFLLSCQPLSNDVFIKFVNLSISSLPYYSWLLSSDVLDLFQSRVALGLVKCGVFDWAETGALYDILSCPCFWCSLRCPSSICFWAYSI